MGGGGISGLETWRDNVTGKIAITRELVYVIEVELSPTLLNFDAFERVRGASMRSAKSRQARFFWLIRR